MQTKSPRFKSDEHAPPMPWILDLIFLRPGLSPMAIKSFKVLRRRGDLQLVNCNLEQNSWNKSSISCHHAFNLVLLKWTYCENPLANSATFLLRMDSLYVSVPWMGRIKSIFALVTRNHVLLFHVGLHLFWWNIFFAIFAMIFWNWRNLMQLLVSR